MSRVPDRPRSRYVQRSSLFVAAVALAWAVALVVSGGFDGTLLHVPITAHDAKRPLLAASLALMVYLLAGGETSGFVALLERCVRDARPIVAAAWRRAPGPTATAWVLAAAMTAVALIWGTKAVGGSDSWGYMSEAQLWRHGGDLHVRQPFANDVPWPSGRDTFTPLAYHPLSDYHEVSDADSATIVPFYSAGLPLLMAAAGWLAGYQAMFFVVPILSGALVIATYGIGRRLASPAVGLIGAWLVATSPCVMFMMMSTMTDVPVAGAFATAFWLMLEPGWMAAAGAGVAAGIGILIRPNFAPFAAIMGLYYAAGLFRRDERLRSLLHGALFSVSVAAAGLTVAAINNAAYGSPTMSGYGRLSQFFSLDHIVPNLQRYPAWLAESQTPLALVGLAAVFVPSRRLWRGQRTRVPIVVAALCVTFVWGMYLVYDVYDAWWFSRFILASWPFIMLGTAAVAVFVTRWHPAITVPAVAIVLVAVSLHQMQFAVDKNTFNLWAGERRYVVAAKMARRLTPRNSVIISGQHSGSLRFYAGRVSMHYDPIDRVWVDRIVDWFIARGVHPYMMLEDWEVPYVKEHFAGQRVTAALEKPVAEYYDPGTLYFYDLDPHASLPAKPEIVTGTYRDFWAVEPVPAPTLVYRP